MFLSLEAHLSSSARGPGTLVLTQETRVRIPLRTPKQSLSPSLLAGLGSRALIPETRVRIPLGTLRYAVGFNAHSSSRPKGRVRALSAACRKSLPVSAVSEHRSTKSVASVQLGAGRPMPLFWRLQTQASEACSPGSTPGKGLLIMQ